jgi:hypothetical protein
MEEIVSPSGLLQIVFQPFLFHNYPASQSGVREIGCPSDLAIDEIRDMGPGTVKQAGTIVDG